jgi:hypothetical protein
MGVLLAGTHPTLDGSDLALVVIGIVVALVASAVQARPATVPARTDLLADALWVVAASLLILGVVPSGWYLVAFLVLLLAVCLRAAWYFRGKKRSGRKGDAGRPVRRGSLLRYLPQRPRIGRSRAARSVGDWFQVLTGDAEAGGKENRAELEDILGPLPPDEDENGTASLL